jgi:hypothetical protein
MKVEFGKGCFLDYTARKFYRRDQTVRKDRKYFFRFDNMHLNRVHVWMSYIGTNWDEKLK